MNLKSQLTTHLLTDGDKVFDNKKSISEAVQSHPDVVSDLFMTEKNQTRQTSYKNSSNGSSSSSSSDSIFDSSSSSYGSDTDSSDSKVSVKTLTLDEVKEQNRLLDEKAKGIEIYQEGQNMVFGGWMGTVTIEESLEKAKLERDERRQQ